MGCSIGDLFKVYTFGESHGGGVGVIVDGCPPRLDLDIEKIQQELDRRKPRARTYSSTLKPYKDYIGQLQQIISASELITEFEKSLGLIELDLPILKINSLSEIIDRKLKSLEKNLFN